MVGHSLTISDIVCYNTPLEMTSKILLSQLTLIEMTYKILPNNIVG